MQPGDKNSNSTLDPVNSDQQTYWNSDAGLKWITYQEQLDNLMESVKARLLQRAGVRPGDQVLEIGCGTGATTRSAARQAGPDGRVTAADISEPLVGFAKNQPAETDSSPIDYLLGDAQTYPFETGQFDQMISRFGVMFFGDPVAAFENITRAVTPGGGLTFACWAALSDNPWFTIPGRAAIAQLGKPAPLPADAPGPFAFAEQDRVLQIMRAAGLQDCSAAAEGITLDYHGSAEDAARLACSVGPAVRIMQEFGGTDQDLVAIQQATAAEFSAFYKQGTVHIPASINFYMAKTG